MNQEEKDAWLKGLGTHFTNKLNNPGQNLMFPISELPNQVQSEMRIFFGLKNFTDNSKLTEWETDLLTYLKERCSPGNFIDALIYGVEVGKIINNDYLKNSSMTPQNDPFVKNWALRLPVTTDLLKRFESGRDHISPIEITPIAGKHSAYIKKALIEDSGPWNYYFESMTDLDMFVDCLNSHFTGELPANLIGSIKLNKKSKTKLAKALHPIYWKLTSTSPLNRDVAFCNAIRVLDEFKDINPMQLSRMM